MMELDSRFQTKQQQAAVFPSCLLLRLSLMIVETHTHTHVHTPTHIQSYGWVNLTDCHQNTVMGLKPPSHHNTNTQSKGVCHCGGRWLTGLEMLMETNVSSGQQSEQHVVLETQKHRLSYSCNQSVSLWVCQCVSLWGGFLIDEVQSYYTVTADVWKQEKYIFFNTDGDG